MIKRFIICSVLLSFVGFTGCRQKEEPARIFDREYREVLKKAREEAFYYMARNFVPGSSIAVSVKGKLVWSEGIGQASTDLGVPASRFIKYRIGQISQVLTSLAYYRMVEEERLSPHENVWNYFPGYPEKKFPLHLQHLADHTSGIRQPTEEEAARRGYNISLVRGIDVFSQDSLLFPPGMYQFPTVYSYTLLGAVMEEVSGKSFNQVIRQYVTDTLHLENTVPDNPFITIKGRSSFYEYNIVAQVIHSVTTDLRYRMPFDGYLSTAEDLVKLGNALLFSPLLSDTVKHMMFKAPVPEGDIPASQGNGFLFLRDREGKSFYASHGVVKGSAAMLLIFPEEELVLAWLSNLDDTGEELPGLRVAKMFIDSK